jgi:hypothetical protein
MVTGRSSLVAGPSFRPTCSWSSPSSSSSSSSSSSPCCLRSQVAPKTTSVGAQPPARRGLSIGEACQAPSPRRAPRGSPAWTFRGPSATRFPQRWWASKRHAQHARTRRCRRPASRIDQPTPGATCQPFKPALALMHECQAAKTSGLPVLPSGLSARVDPAVSKGRTRRRIPNPEEPCSTASPSSSSSW